MNCTITEAKERPININNVIQFMIGKQRQILLIIGVIVFMASTDFVSETSANESIRVLKGKGKIHVESRGVDYTTDVTALIALDGRFSFSLNNHWNYSEGEIQFSFDGETFYYLVERKDKNDLAFLSSGPIPIFPVQDCARDALWYALGSSQFLSHNETSSEILHLYNQPREDINAYGFRYEAKLLDQIPVMARRLLILKDRSLDMDTRDAEEGRLQIDPYRLYATETTREEQWAIKDSWTDGAVAIEVIWDGEDVVKDNLVLPAGFTSLTYSASRPESAPIWRVTGSSFSWVYVSRFNGKFQPEISRKVRVSDGRVRRRSNTHYVSYVIYPLNRGEEWLGADAPIVQGLIDPTMASSPLPSAKSSTRLGPLVVGIGIVIVILAPAAFLWTQKKKLNKH